jgi:hypothetical protein
MRPIKLFLVAAVVATMAGCGSSSTGRISADAVLKEADAFGGPTVKLYSSQAQIIDADDQTRSLPLVVACKPGGDCEVIAPDGASYPDVQHLVDGTRLIDRGDEVFVNSDLTHPGASTHLAEYKKSAVPSWAWWAGGSALLLVLLLIAAGLIRRKTTRRRRQPPEDDATAG